MRLKKLKKLEQDIFELTYSNWLGIERSRKIFVDTLYFKWADTGNRLDLFKNSSIKAFSRGMEIGDVKTF